MKTYIAVALGALSLSAAAPAFAQDYGRDHHDQDRQQGRDYDRDHGRDHDRGDMRDRGGAGWDIDRRLAWMDERIERGQRDGSLDRRETFRVRSELRSIRDQERRMRYRDHGRLDERDRAILERRLDDLNARIRWLRHNDERSPWR